ncbi:TonB-dependent receptor [Pseudomonas oligotrophica]|uniref:TonB-dependent receptor n=1 Tax=Pseudomonas oligotrophica TaxID=2912055 RepID=UPI001EFFB109|nr:TonB-dependent siderophore receptor [Pseudomonas oligotrophica]MCF7200790.1 TonB-dependent siderophore receptor [Pseudomonas oligotrophica]
MASVKSGVWVPLLTALAAPVALAQTAQLELPATDVTGLREESSYKPEQSKSALKIDAALRDIPQSISVVPQALLEDQGADSLEDALKNVPGIGLSNGDGQRDQVTIRGFSAIGDMYIDGIRDDALYYRDMSNIERVEVIKGPAAVLYGRGSSGGLINSVSKKPTFAPEQEIGVSFDSEGKRRTQFDAGWADEQQQDKAFRVTGALEDSDTFRDGGFLERKALAPSAYFRLSDDLELNLGASYLYDKRLIDFGIPALDGRPVKVDPDKRFGSADPDQDYTRSEVFSLTAGLDYRINDAFTLSNTTRYYHYDLDRNNTLAHTDANRFVTAADGSLLVKLKRGNVQRKEDGWFNQTELKQTAQLAGINHQLLYGVEIGRQEKDQLFYNLNDVARVPVYGDGLVRVPSQAPGKTGDGLNTQQTLGFYVQDLIELSPHWKALLGLRYDEFEQRYRDDLKDAELERTDYTLSPRAGLVWQPDDVQAYYLSVSRSYQPSGEMFQISAANAELDPEETTNYEIGAKWNLLDDRLLLTAALFRLERTQIKTADPVDPSKLVLAGEQRTDGFELTFTGQVTDQWQLYGGYAYLDAEITKSNSNTGGVPNEGQVPTLTPRHSANLWAVRSLSPEWRVGMGANYVGRRYTSLDNVTQMPGYTTVDAALFYQQPKWDAALRLFNLFDKEYYASAHGSVDLITPGAPRTLELSANYRF